MGFFIYISFNKHFFLKIVFFCLFVVSFQGMFAQQNEEFRTVKNYFDHQRLLLADTFRTEAAKTDDKDMLLVMKKDFLVFMEKLDSIQNVSLINALIKVKNRESLEKIKNPQSNFPEKKVEELNKKLAPNYPGGAETLRKTIANLFYFDANLPEISTLTSEINFSVTKAGYITNVIAFGENPVFNRQAEIAVYMLPDKFTFGQDIPTEATYNFRMPLTMNFK